MDINGLFNGRCVVSIQFPDKSEIQCITTLSQEILKSLGIVDCDCFVDLLVFRKIPPELLIREDLTITITPGTKLTLNPLDALFQQAIKSTWEKV